MLPEDDRVIETCRRVLSVLMSILDYYRQYMCICWCVTEINYRMHGATMEIVRPAFYTVDTGSFPGVKRPGRGVDQPPPSSAEVEGRVELYICSSSRPSWPVLG